MLSSSQKSSLRSVIKEFKPSAPLVSSTSYQAGLSHLLRQIPPGDKTVTSTPLSFPLRTPSNWGSDWSLVIPGDILGKSILTFALMALSFDLVLAASSQWPVLSALVAVFGAFSIARLIFQTMSVLLQTFFLSGTSLKRFGARQGAWAVITGASDGIGKEFSLQLAKAGFNVFLVARNKVTLQATASEIQNKYPGVSTQVHSIDFSKHDDAAYNALSAALEGLNIGVLVNNVGKSHAMPAYFVDTPQDEIKDIVTINVNATLRVTHAVLPGMVQRKRGLVLNIGSFSGAVPSPMLATYSGTKAFLTTFSAALGEEVKQHGIVVEHTNTYFVVSKMSKIRKDSAMVPTPAGYVRSVLSKVGLACGAAYSGRPNTSTPYWSHALLDYGMTLVGIPGLFISYTHGLHQSIRKRALRKLERETKAE